MKAMGCNEYIRDLRKKAKKEGRAISEGVVADLRLLFKLHRLMKRNGLGSLAH